jgi:hypothetical protein
MRAGMVVMTVVTMSFMAVVMIVCWIVHSNVTVAQGVSDTRRPLSEAGFAVTLKGAAHEDVQPVLL